MRALSFDDISLMPRYNNIPSRKVVDTSVKFGRLTLRMPIMSANMDTITGVRMAAKMTYLGGLGFLHRFCSIDENVRMFMELGTGNGGGAAVMSLGVNEGLDRFRALHTVGARYFCLDVAHGHSKEIGKLVTQIKEYDQGVFLVAGNVCTAEGAEYLADKGADAIKVGIGPGSVCSTRVKTGFGIPQFTAIQECRHVNCFLIADGGVKTPGDAVKAFAAGADAIMVGGMLAGTDETPGDVVEEPIYETASPAGFLRRKVKRFRGMASKEAQDAFMGSMADWKTAEGIEIKVEAKGPVADVMADLMGGIRSGMTYCGANTIGQIRERA
ncbi:MAG: guanosine monophosphate reductase, partial [Nitrososphaera sp.]|nr:guanosine monophosphate reductase [Nitrososphaera sp.]